MFAGTALYDVVIVVLSLVESYRQLGVLRRARPAAAARHTDVWPRDAYERRRGAAQPLPTVLHALCAALGRLGGGADANDAEKAQFAPI